MKSVRKHMTKQQETVWVVSLALVTVVIYTLWGASLLRAQEQATTNTGTSVVINR